jgi:hypothetical protein
MNHTCQVLNQLEGNDLLHRRVPEAVDALKPEIARLFAAKEARRHKLAALPFPEKVRAAVRLQEMAAPGIARAR